MVMRILWAIPALVRKGGRGIDVRESPEYGWDIRVTVIGGPDVAFREISKVKVPFRALEGGVAGPI
jgi:hypothetical protein